MQSSIGRCDEYIYQKLISTKRKQYCGTTFTGSQKFHYRQRIMCVLCWTTWSEHLHSQIAHTHTHPKAHYTMWTMHASGPDCDPIDENAIHVAITYCKHCCDGEFLCKHTVVTLIVRAPPVCFRVHLLGCLLRDLWWCVRSTLSCGCVAGSLGLLVIRLQAPNCANSSSPCTFPLINTVRD